MPGRSGSRVPTDFSVLVDDAGLENRAVALQRKQLKLPNIGGKENRDNEILACDTQVRERLNRSTVTKLSLKLAQNEQKLSNSRQLRTSLSCSWQRDLIGFSIR
jgi:hypothetical protein